MVINFHFFVSCSSFQCPLIDSLTQWSFTILETAAFKGNFWNLYRKECGTCYYSAPDRGAEYCDERACLSVCDHIFRTTRTYDVRSSNFLCKLPMAVARSSSVDVLINYIFPVLWMTWYLHISWGDVAARLRWRGFRALGLARRNTQYRQWTLGDYLLPSGPTRPQWTCWIFMTSCLRIMSLCTGI